MKTFIRDNWSKAILTTLFEGQILVNGHGVESEFVLGRNTVIREIVQRVKALPHETITNDEILAMLDMMSAKREEYFTSVESYTEEDISDAIYDLVDHMYGFKNAASRFGSLGYSVEDDTVYHIGEIPDEMKIQLHRVTK